MADWGPVLVGVVLFIVFSSGLLFQIPGNNRLVEFGSMKINRKAICFNTLMFFAVYTILILVFHLHIYTGNYYLVDAGYSSKKGYLGPYKGERYHHQIFRGGVSPKNAKERFNRAHSSLRSVIERTFGVWKKRWAFLENMPPYRGFDQVRLVCASMALHNFIRRHGLDNEHFQEADDQGEDYPYDASEEEQNFDLGGDMDEMETLRCGIANVLSRQRSQNHNNS